MEKNPHLWVAITGHGLGHLTQTAPLIESLREGLPGCRLSVQTQIPEAVVATRIRPPFCHIPELEDPGMIMASAIDTLPNASFEAYRALHGDWPRHLERQRALLQADPPDLLIANISYLALAGAEELGIRNIALCSLNWADIFAGYCGERPDAAPWITRMRSIYAGADLFLRPDPSMPMAWLPNGHSIGPITTLGRNRRAEVCGKLGIPPEERLLLVTLGGIPTRLDYREWSSGPGLNFIIQGMDIPSPAGHLYPAARIEMPFPDLIHSVDAVVTKPGYGTFAKCGCLGKPVIYIPRGDWPEEPHAVAWLHQHSRAMAVDREHLAHGRFLPVLDELLSRPAPTPATASGAREGAEILLGRFFARSRSGAGMQR
ncbi:MAG: hypothetical protein KJ558_11320 [Gammaproteobacteria bacterium]|nr:hypothetical protein [Gammaproteobacteria bacterium]MBU1655397.1 hypothetical protein [Gammaproteobacteria bacterium]MBU1961850.1 hypothetical protein [Gammaproteobacteria bacterium]